MTMDYLVMITKYDSYDTCSIINYTEKMIDDDNDWQLNPYLDTYGRQTNLLIDRISS